MLALDKMPYSKGFKSGPARKQPLRLSILFPAFDPALYKMLTLVTQHVVVQEVCAENKNSHLYLQDTRCIIPARSCSHT